MKKSTQKSMIQTTILVVLSLFLLAFSASATTSEEKDKKNKKEAVQPEGGINLEAELEASISEVLAELEEKVDKVVVYDLAGNLVQTQDKGNVNLGSLPLNATLLMKEKDTHYYIITE